MHEAHRPADLHTHMPMNPRILSVSQINLAPVVASRSLLSKTATCVHFVLLAAQLRLVEKLSVGSEAYLQAALLYTTVAGQRRIRVHTMALTVTDSISTLFKNADLDAQVGEGGGGTGQGLGVVGRGREGSGAKSAREAEVG